MRAQGGVYSFSGVDVGLPSKVRGSEAEEEWQEVDWVTWSTGELTVDAESFLLVFKPAGGVSGTVKSKPLGNLLRASAVEGTREGAKDSEGRTVVITTSDSLHRLYRLTFPSGPQAREFQKVADAAEAASADRCAGEVGGAASADALSRLLAELRARLAERLPLLYGGVELYGSDPGGAKGSEVLLGRGAAVLLDPAEEGKVGTYELLFYGEDEGAREPVKCIAIGPRMTLTRQKPDSEEEEGPEAVLALAGAAEAYTITFDEASVAATFIRDFRVRQRVMDLSLKTVKGSKTADRLREELEGIRRRSLAARLWQLLCGFVLLAVVAAAARVALLYAQDGGAKAPVRYAEQLVDDVQLAVKLSFGAVTTAGAKVCELAVGSVPAADVRRCAALAAKQTPSYPKVRKCLEALIGPV